MKKLIFATVISLLSFAGAQAQKYVTVDMEYILKNIPAYERANEQLNQQSRRWQGEIDELVRKPSSLFRLFCIMRLICAAVS